MRFGAQYVVHEDSGFLSESVLRIYPLMDLIVFLVGAEPWNGQGNRETPAQTILTIYSIPDPDKKFVIVSKHWTTEAQERNEGLRILREAGVEWCMIVDDDEMFNRENVKAAKIEISKDGVPPLFLAAQRIYWKNRETAIEGLTAYLPLFARTRKGEVLFTEGRCCDVRGGAWICLPPEVILCHHLSYVRTDPKMKRKITTFTHADAQVLDWFERVWLRWTPPMENLHPNPKARESFKRAVPAALGPWRLEPFFDLLKTKSGAPSIRG